MTNSNTNSLSLPLLVAAKALQSTTLRPRVAEAREAIAPGQYRVETTVRISATCSVGEDFRRRQTQTVPWQELFALALSKLNGVTAESLVREFMTAGAPATAEIKQQVTEAIEAIRGTTWEEQRGMVRLTDLEVEVL